MPSPRRQPTRGGNRRGLVFVSRVMDARSTMARLGGLMTLMVLMAACAGYAAAPSATPSAPAASPPDTPVSAPPSVEPSSGGPSTDPVPPVGGKPVLPKPGQAVNVHPVPAERLEARVDGSTIIVRATWTSGVEPCAILDSIVVDKGEGSYTVTLREGSSPQEIACIALAEQHVTEFEIPDVAPGTWSIVDSGGTAPPVEVTVG